jgi:hypothetical protein
MSRVVEHGLLCASDSQQLAARVYERFAAGWQPTAPFGPRRPPSGRSPPVKAETDPQDQRGLKGGGSHRP